MSFLDRLVTGGGTVLLAVVRTLYADALETRRRKNSPLCFDQGLTQGEFIDIVRDTARRTPRVEDVFIAGMNVTLSIGSISGLSTWRAEVDFNDYGRLTGAYWLDTENSDSLIPNHFAHAVKAQIEGRVRRTSSEQG